LTSTGSAIVRPLFIIQFTALIMGLAFARPPPAGGGEEGLEEEFRIARDIKISLLLRTAFRFRV